jgi:ATP-binding protein involved in chromosome partitioning
MGLKVGLFDADFYGPSLPVLINKTGVQARASEDNPQQPLPIDFEGIKTMSFGFVNTKEKSLLKGPIVSSLISHLVKNTLWGQLDVLFIDTPPGTGDINIKLS